MQNHPCSAPNERPRLRNTIDPTCSAEWWCSQLGSSLVPRPGQGKVGVVAVPEAAGSPVLAVTREATLARESHSRETCTSPHSDGCSLERRAVWQQIWTYSPFLRRPEEAKQRTRREVRMSTKRQIIPTENKADIMSRRPPMGKAARQPNHPIFSSLAPRGQTTQPQTPNHSIHLRVVIHTAGAWRTANVPT